MLGKKYIFLIYSFVFFSCLNAGNALATWLGIGSCALWFFERPYCALGLILLLLQTQPVSVSQEDSCEQSLYAFSWFACVLVASIFPPLSQVERGDTFFESIHTPADETF